LIELLSAFLRLLPPHSLKSRTFEPSYQVMIVATLNYK